MRLPTALVALAALAGLTACEAPTEAELLPVVVHTPLENDPTDPFDIAEWWSDGRSLLRLGSDGGYTMWDGMNRYAPPRQSGRWSQESHVFLWLEPYQGHEPQRRRVMIRRVQGEILLVTMDERAWHDVPGPPPMLEDRLVGPWSGPHGALELDGNGQYQYMPGDELGPGNVITVGHRGRWWVDGDVLELRPDPAGLGPYRLAIATDDDAVVLSSEQGAYVKQERAAVAGP